MSALRWQDLVLSLVSGVFSASLLPLVVSRKTVVARLTSVPTALGLLTIGLVYLSLHLWLSSALSLATGLLWGFLSVKRGPRANRT